MMFRKQKGLAMNCENLEKIYVIENKKVIQRLAAEGREKKVPQQNLWVDCGSGRAPRVW
jgi:hypothetical protein